MGSLQAQEMAEMLDIESAISWHLSSNHYPPVTQSMVPACLEAIENAIAGNWLKKVELPAGTTYRGSRFAPTDAIIDQHHLETWVELDEEGME